MISHKHRSDHILKFIKEHPAINVAMVCRLAGDYDVHNFTNALNGGMRKISRDKLPLFEKVLKDYGYEPLKEGDKLI